MEVVKLFNTELSSLYETRPPISKAKMTSITRTAIKAIKFYKHVVQSVEKFIQKCKPEYKVPGLYVIDSIVRQSRHQFTPEKDVFAPRFARNITTTFQHLFNCPHDDKGKIVRVLNLWQKNQVFTPEVIQPLLDLASREQPVTNGIQQRASSGTDRKVSSPVKEGTWEGSQTASMPQPVIAPLTQSASKTAVSTNTSAIDHIPPVKFDKKLLDFDYGEEEEEEASPQPTQPLPSLDSLTSILSNPEVLRQLQTLQAQMSARAAQEEEKSRRLQEMRTQEEEFDKHLAQTLPNLPFASECDFKGTTSVMDGSGSGGAPVVGVPAPPPVAAPHHHHQLTVPPPIHHPLHVPSHHHHHQHHQHVPAYRTNLEESSQQQVAAPPPPLPQQPPPSTIAPPPTPLPSSSHHDYDERAARNELMRGGVGGVQSGGGGSNASGGGGVVEVIDLIRMESESRESPPRRRRRSSRSPPSSHRRSSGRSPSRSSKRRRSRSGDRDYDRGDWSESGRKSSREAEREKERERRRKGLPPIKKNHLAVCSTTLWIGHLSKLVQQEELSDTFGEYGDIVSINLIPPRGCAFVCMNRRQDAARALHQLKHYKLQGKAITMAWAPGKGMKDREWKDYWEVEQGVSYIPWSKLSPDTDFELLEDGGMLDPDTFPDWLTEKMNAKRDKERALAEGVGGILGSVNEGLGGGTEEGNIGGNGSELDIPMPRNHPPPIGYIPIPSSHPHPLPDPTPVSNTVTPIPPPMGIIPPFALPSLSDNVSLMGMGLMRNVPLGVPPPLMMPQQMVPRMPASPFNPPLILGGGEKGKGTLGPASGDSFPDHLAPLVNPFGLPVPLSVVDPRLRRLELEHLELEGGHGVQAHLHSPRHHGGGHHAPQHLPSTPRQSLNASGLLGAPVHQVLNNSSNGNNKGMAEMEVDDSSEHETKEGILDSHHLHHSQQGPHHHPHHHHHHLHHLHLHHQTLNPLDLPGHGPDHVGAPPVPEALLHAPHTILSVKNTEVKDDGIEVKEECKESEREMDKEGGGNATDGNKEEIIEGVCKKEEREKEEGNNEEDGGGTGETREGEDVEKEDRNRLSFPSNISSNEQGQVSMIKSEHSTPSGKRQRKWPRVNRWGDSSPPQNQPTQPPPLMQQQIEINSRMNEGHHGVPNLMLPPEHHFLPGHPPPNRPMGGLMGGVGGGFVKGVGERDDMMDEEMGPMFMGPRGGGSGFFPPGRGRPPRPLLRTPNGPMFGPRGPPPGPLMPPMRGPRPPGVRMEGMGFGGGMRGRGRGRGIQRRWGHEASECA